MTPLTRIQMVVHLQTVELFAHCTAEQVVRIAGIARQKVLRQGEKIYSVNDAAEALFSVVAGEVVLDNRGGEQRCISSGSTFGVREILAGRLRAEDAVASAEGIALEIEADDFFDLLSNNIEIVKALFRQLMSPSTKDLPASALQPTPSLSPRGGPSP